MKRHSRAGMVAAIVLATTVFGSEEASAQSWQWQSAVHNADQGMVATESRVVLSARDVAITYSATVDSRNVPITSCRAELTDIGNVHSVDNNGKLFLFIVLKPQRSASCNSGSQSIAVLPIGRDASANSAIATIMRACCRTSAVPAIVAQAPRPTPSPTTAATVAPQSLSPVDWVESAGLFAFVRLLNRDSRPLVVSAGQVLDCRDVAAGCGSFVERPLTVAPGRVVTLATVTSNNPANAPSFSYRYEVQAEHARFTESGVSAKRAADPATVMSAQDIRVAEALALGQIRTQRSASTPSPAAYVAPRLVQRGSTRFGVGQKGVALVRVGVGRDGSAQYATIISISNRALTAAALETAVSTKFSPALKNGNPTDGNYVATFQFDGQDPGLASIPVWRRTSNSPPGAAASPNLSAVAVPTPIPSLKPSPSPSPKPSASPSPSPSQSPSPVSAPSPRGSTQ